MSQAGQIVFLTAIESLTGNTGGYVEPALGNINIYGTGDVSVANAIPGDPTSATLIISISEFIANTYTTNSGNAVPLANVLNVLGGTNISTVGSGNTITIDLYDTITLPITTSNASKGVFNIGVANPVLQAYGSNNIFLGGAGNFTLTSAQDNVGVGFSSIETLTTGSYNSALGVGSGGNFTTGSYGIYIGYLSASEYFSSESSNIVIGNVGTTGESHKIRIGTYGTGNGQQDTAYIAGIVHASNGLVSDSGNITATSGYIDTVNNSIIVGSTATAAAANDLDFKRIHGSAVVAAGDQLGNITFQGYDGSAYVLASYIQANVTGTPGASRVGSTLALGTHPDSTHAAIERVLIDSTGDVTIHAPDSGVALTITAGGETITAGDLVVTAGNITATAGSVSAGTTVTAGTNLISTAGNLQLPTTSSTVGQIEINSVPVLHAYGTHNIFVGPAAGNFTLNVAYGTDNVALGYGALAYVNGAYGTVGLNNVAIGSEAISTATNPANCIAIGYSAGSAWATYETSNIAIGHTGVAAESNVIHLGGGTGSSAGKQNKCFISGIYNISVGATAGVNITDSTDQIGTISGTTGQVLQGGTKPAFSTATYPSTVSKGDVLIASADEVVDVVSGAVTAGYVLTSNGTGTVPSFQEASSGGMEWNSVSGSTQAIAVNNGYIPTNTALTTLTLPATAALGSTVAVAGYGSGGWKLAQNSGQLILFGAYSTTSGTSGALFSSTPTDVVTLLCIVADTTWTVISAVGNLFVV